MKSRWFENYGELEWLEPADYYAGNWTYVGYALDDDGETYDLVRSGDSMEMRYTTI